MTQLWSLLLAGHAAGKETIATGISIVSSATFVRSLMPALASCPHLADYKAASAGGVRAGAAQARAGQAAAVPRKLRARAAARPQRAAFLGRPVTAVVRL